MAQTETTDIQKLRRTQFEINPSFVALYSSSNFDPGAKLEMALRKDRLRYGIYGEYSQGDFHSMEVITESFSKVIIIDKDVSIYQVGLFGEYSPFSDYNSFNPYLFGQGGILTGDFPLAYVLSLGIGSEFLIPLSSRENLWPFIEVGYQKSFNLTENLNLNGLRFEVGFRIKL